MSTKMYTFEDVYKHNKTNDCWLIISGKVYDVTPFMDDHPGGDEVLLYSTGKDATNDFEDVGHSSWAREMMAEYYIGEIGPSTVPKVYSFKDVSQHNKARDGWLIISGKVYDVTPFIDDHPGGDKVLLSATGKDATNDFEDVGHSDSAREMMDKYYIGEIDPSTVPLKRTYAPLPQPHGEAPVAFGSKFRRWLRFENVEKIEDPRKEVSKDWLKIDEDQTDSAHTKVVIATEKKQELEKVIETARVVDVLEEGANGNSNSIELLLDELGRKKIRQYSHKDLTSITENFSNQIGSGAYGDVFKGKLPIGVQVAVKKLKDNTMNVMEFTFMAEVRTMSSTLHRHLVILYGYCFEVNMKALVYEYLENGSFDKVLYENHLNLPWEKLYEIAIGTAKGLSYLHEGCVHEIVHYDVKPGNVLLDSKLCPKVADFGMAKVSQRDLSHISLIEFRGTRSYAAPEMWMQMPVTSKSDIYSFGMMLFEVLGRKKNLDGENWLPGQVWEKFKKGQLDEIMDECGIAEKDKTKAKTLATIALWCTQYRPNDRPTMSVVVQVLMGNIQLPSPPDPLYPYSGSSSGSTWGGGSTQISGPPTAPISMTTSI